MPQPNPGLYQLDRDLSRGEVLRELAATPHRLRAILDGASEAGLVAKPDAESWSALQVLGHMRDAALVYSARFRWIAFDDAPLLPDYNEDGWVAASRDVAADVPEIVDQIEASRADLVRVLGRLADEDWTRTGRHAVLGEVVLDHYVRHQLAHEESHLEQLREALRAVASG